METYKANERTCHLMVSDHRQPRPRLTPEKLEGRCRQCKCCVAKLNAKLCLDTRAKKFKYIFYLEWRSNPQPVVFTVSVLLLYFKIFAFILDLGYTYIFK